VPVDVRITVRRARLMDDDNLIASLKMIQDLLFKDQGVTPDDSPKWVQIVGGIRQEIAPRYRYAPEVEYLVTERQ
jgi:hypothetical protein